MVKVVLAKDNADYMIFLLSPGEQKSTEIKPDRYYLKLRYYEGKKFSFAKGDEFSFIDGDQITIKLDKVIFGNYGTSGISGSEF